MRITNSVLARSALQTVRDGLSGIDRAQQEVASGRKLTKPSDDPAAAADLLTAERRLSALGQYQRNISAASSRLSGQESALNELDGILVRARELATGQLTDTSNAQTRAVAAEEVDRLAEAAIQLANSRFGSGFLFGGYHSNQAPYPISTTAPPAGQATVEIAEGQSIATVIDGVELFYDSDPSGNTGLIRSLQDLASALRANDKTAMTSAAQEIDGAFSGVQVALGETGARVQQLELAKNNAESLELGLKAYRSDLSEIDLEEAVTNLLSRQNALQAALMATSRLMDISLTDYLR